MTARIERLGEVIDNIEQAEWREVVFPDGTRGLINAWGPGGGFNLFRMSHAEYIQKIKQTPLPTPELVLANVGFQLMGGATLKAT